MRPERDPNGVSCNLMPASYFSNSLLFLAVFHLLPAHPLCMLPALPVPHSPPPLSCLSNMASPYLLPLWQSTSTLIRQDTWHQVLWMVVLWGSLLSLCPNTRLDASRWGVSFIPLCPFNPTWRESFSLSELLTNTVDPHHLRQIPNVPINWPLYTIHFTH